jgi:ribonuclease J
MGPFEVDFVRVRHSIPDGMGLGIHTLIGTVVQTGDFKFDPTPVDQNMSHFSKFAELGDRGVLALLSDCTNVERPGFTPSERAVRPHLEEVIRNAPKRVVIATFASHVHRLQQVIDISAEKGRKVAATGRSMISTIRIASELGYLKIPANTMISVDDINAYLPHEVTVLTTGSQGEPMSALALIARQDHRRVKISEGDIVVLSAKPVPGNEHLVNQVINHLYRQGAEVLYDPVDPVHVSGHGNQEDLKLMLNLTRPKFVVPYHGEARHMIRYARLAESVGVPRENIFLLKLGDVLNVTPDQSAVTNSVPFGDVMIDGLGVGDVGAAVLRDRRHLAEEGMLIVVLSINRQNGEVLSGPDIISRGFVYEPLSEEFLERAKEKVSAVLTHLSKAQVTEWGSINVTVRESLSKFIYTELRRRPMVVPIVMEV